MIIIDQNQCNGCGLWAKICHEHCLSLIENEVRINYEVCSTCTQCIAVCPQQAVSWDGVPPIAFDKERLPSSSQLDELFKERRTIRFFNDKRIDRPVIEEIVSTGVYAPTNIYDLRAMVVDATEILDGLEQILMRHVKRIYKLIFRPKMVFNLMRKLTPKIDPEDKVKMETAMARGYNFKRPPALLLIIGDKRVALAEASAQYALANMTYAAQARGIGTRLRGQGLLFYDRNKAARKLLGLRKHENILGMMELGHPAVKFLNKVAGKIMPIQWNTA